MYAFFSSTSAFACVGFSESMNAFSGSLASTAGTDLSSEKFSDTSSNGTKMSSSSSLTFGASAHDPALPPTAASVCTGSSSILCTSKSHRYSALTAVCGRTPSLADTRRTSAFKAS